MQFLDVLGKEIGDTCMIDSKGIYEFVGQEFSLKSDQVFFDTVING